MILVWNLMNDLGIILDFNNKSMVWDGSTVTMCGYGQNQKPTILSTNLLLDVLDSNVEANDSIIMLDKPSDMNYHEKDVDPSRYKTKLICTSLYEQSNLQDIVDKCAYLLPYQREQLHFLLNQFHNLFDRRLKTFKGPPVHLKLFENPVPVHWRPYTIRTSHLAVIKEELSCLISIGVTKKAKRSNWIARTFIAPKKDGHVQWSTDSYEVFVARFTPSARSVRSSNAAWAISISQNSTSACNTIPLSWMILCRILRLTTLNSLL